MTNHWITNMDNKCDENSVKRDDFKLEHPLESGI